MVAPVESGALPASAAQPLPPPPPPHTHHPFSTYVVASVQRQAVGSQHQQHCDQATQLVLEVCLLQVSGTTRGNQLGEVPGLEECVCARARACACWKCTFLRSAAPPGGRMEGRVGLNS